MVDRIGIALGALAAGAAVGAALIAAGLGVFRPSIETALPLVVFGGIALAATTGWVVAGPIDDTWRRAVTATLAVFAALMLAGLAAPIDMVGGRIGLLAYSAALAVAGAVAVRATMLIGAA